VLHQDIAQGSIKMKCAKCKKEVKIKSKEYVTTKKESEVSYDMEADYKIGQKVTHDKFKDSGFVVGRTESSIIVDFEENKIKKLVSNYAVKGKGK